MGSTWKKVKVALGLNMCLYGPRNLHDSLPSMASRSSDAVAPPNLLSSASFSSDCRPSATPTSSSSGLRLSKSSTRSSKVCWGWSFLLRFWFSAGVYLVVVLMQSYFLTYFFLSFFLNLYLWSFQLSSFLGSFVSAWWLF